MKQLLSNQYEETCDLIMSLKVKSFETEEEKFYFLMKLAQIYEYFLIELINIINNNISILSKNDDFYIHYKLKFYNFNDKCFDEKVDFIKSEIISREDNRKFEFKKLAKYNLKDLELFFKTINIDFYDIDRKIQEGKSHLILRDFSTDRNKLIHGGVWNIIDSNKLEQYIVFIPKFIDYIYDCVNTRLDEL